MLCFGFGFRFWDSGLFGSWWFANLDGVFCGLCFFVGWVKWFGFLGDWCTVWRFGGKILGCCLSIGLGGCKFLFCRQIARLWAFWGLFWGSAQDKNLVIGFVFRLHLSICGFGFRFRDVISGFDSGVL